MKAYKEHTLKIWPEYFERVDANEKRCEIRLDDRNYRVGDFIKLKEWNPKTKKYTKRMCRGIITDITDLKQIIPEIKDKWVALHFNGIVLK